MCGIKAGFISVTIALRDYTRELPLDLQVGSTESRIWTVTEVVQRLKSVNFSSSVQSFDMSRAACQYKNWRLSDLLHAHKSSAETKQKRKVGKEDGRKTLTTKAHPQYQKRNPHKKSKVPKSQTPKNTIKRQTLPSVQTPNTLINSLLPPSIVRET